MHRLTSDEVAMIPSLYKSGATLRDIAERFGVSDTAIGKWAAKLGLTVSPSGRFQSKPLPDGEAPRLYGEGLSAERVGAVLGCSRMTAERRIIEAGVFLRGARVQTEDAPIVAAYRQGATVNEIITTLGHTEGVVRRVLRENSVETRKPQPRFHLVGERLDQAVRLYAEGNTSEEVASILSVSPATVIHALRRMGSPVRTPGKGKVRLSVIDGRPMKFDSSWEEQVFRALADSEHRADFLFQGDFTAPDRRSPVFSLPKPPEVAAIYPTLKRVYGWHPDFVLPAARLIVEVKGNYWALRHWHRVILPCIQQAGDQIPFHVVVLCQNPARRSWMEMKGDLIRVL